MYDSLGSISVVTGENGIPIQNYTYSPYGSCLNTENDPVNNLRFVGRYGGYHDDDTGLTYFWHRWYSDEDGRWVSRDMIGVCGDINLFRYVNTVGKPHPYLNLYQYTGNRPTYYIDSNGLCPGGPEWQPLPTIPVAPGPAPTQEPPTKTPGPAICDKNEECIKDCMKWRYIMCGAACIGVAALTEPETFIYGFVIAGGCDAACILYNLNECKKSAVNKMKFRLGEEQ